MVGQAAAPPDPRSPAHATHVPWALQIGVAPPHWAFEVHWTQLCVVGLQTGVGAVQSERLPTVHVAQVPASGPVVTHAGWFGFVQAFEAPEPRSPLHGAH